LCEIHDVVLSGCVQAERSVTGTFGKNKNTGIQFVSGFMVLEDINRKAGYSG